MNRIKFIFLMFTCLYGSAIAFFSATIYLFMSNMGYSLNDINLFIAIFWAISFIAEIPSGVFSDAFGRRNTAIASCFVRALGLMVLILSKSNIFLLIMSGILTALGSALNSGTMTSWLIDEVKKFDSKYNFTVFFSKVNTLSGVTGLLAGYIGAQVIGILNLAYTILCSVLMLVISGVFLMIFVQNDGQLSSSMTISNSYIIYKKTMSKSIHYLKETPRFLCVCMLPIGMAFLTTPAYNQWQLYFKDDSLGIISGYIHVWISILGIVGTYIMSKIKVKNTFLFLKITYILIFISLLLSVLSDNLYIALLFFGMHVMIISMNALVQFTYSNELLRSDIRNSLISVMYALEAVGTVIVMSISGWISKIVGLGMSWVTLGIIGMFFLLVIMRRLYIYENK